ncbi:MAG: DUF4135 domain-containing protein [Thermoanaerobaculaceae bacterium]|nr:DUF4135 domain-containing protein [Thermoanaerobaculaceae bacterium]
MSRRVPRQATLGEAAEALSRWVAGTVERRWPRGWSEQLGAGLHAACRQQLVDLLQVASPDGTWRAWELFQERPVVGRWLVQRAREWAQAAVRLGDRFARDRSAIAHAFGWHRLDGVPARVHWGLSDRHAGESVVALEFPDMPRLFYKPRSLQPEQVLALWFSLFRQAGIPLAPMPPMVRGRGYGWVREVGQVSLEGGNEVRAWFFSAGALAAVAWILGVRDLHWDNVVADREGPVVVDGESWAQPLTVLDGEGAIPSVLSSGLIAMPSMGGAGLREDGALKGGIDPRARSLPLWRGRPADPADFVQEVAAGLEESLQRLARAARESGFGRQCCAAMDGLKVRFVARPSEAYAQLLSNLLASPKVREGWHANLLTEAMLRPLVAVYSDRPPGWELAQEEQRALLHLWVPRLRLPAARRVGVVRETGRRLIRQRLATLTPESIGEQVHLALQALSVSPRGKAGDWFREQAREVAQHLSSAGLPGEPAGLFLDRGLAGHALAWAAWARVSGDAGARRQALLLYERLLALLPQGDGSRVWPVGLCRGWGGLVYALAAGAALLEEPRWAETAARLVTERVPGCEVGEQLDVEGGVAGFILGAWSLLEPFPELAGTLERLARDVLARLPAQADGGVDSVHRPGFAHGLSGVAAALGVLGKATGNRGMVEAAWYLLRAEPGAGRWVAQGTTPTGAQVPAVLQGWCHGAPGAFLARAVAGAGDAPAAVRHQEQQALQVTLTAPLFGTASLCCGSIGRSEILVIGSQLKGRDDLLQQAQTRTELFLRHQGWVGVLSPADGLFAGLPGMLFHLSRLVAPQQVGSVLSGHVQWRPAP